MVSQTQDCEISLTLNLYHFSFLFIILQWCSGTTTLSWWIAKPGLSKILQEQKTWGPKTWILVSSLSPTYLVISHHISEPFFYNHVFFKAEK